MKLRLTWIEWLAVAGNVVFIGWMLFNAMDEGGGTPAQVVSMIGLICLLVLDSVLIASKRRY